MSQLTTNKASILVKKGSEILYQRCLHKITNFDPLSDEVFDTMDLCKDALRNTTGFWKGRGMSVAATQVGKPNVPLFLVCSQKNWYTER